MTATTKLPLSRVRAGQVSVVAAVVPYLWSLLFFVWGVARSGWDADPLAIGLAIGLFVVPVAWGLSIVAGVVALLSNRPIGKTLGVVAIVLTVVHVVMAIVWMGQLRPD